MKRQLFGLSCTVLTALVLAGCTDDPTSSLRGSTSRIATSASYLEILVGNSVEATAQSFDEAGNALTTLPTVTSTSTSIATVTVDKTTSGNPEPITNFTISAVAFGTTTVTATAEGQSATITIQTFPASVSITGIAGGGQLGSGATVQLAGTPLDVDGNAVTGPTITSWSSDNTSIATVDATGLVAGFSPGLVAITATSEGGAEGQLSLEVVPGVFDGTVTNGVLGDLLVVTAGSVPFDGDELIIAVDGFTPVLHQVSNTTFLAQNWGVGTHTVTITQIGATQLAQVGTFDLTGVADVVANGNAGAPTALPTTFPQGYLVTLTAAAPDDFRSLDNTAGASDLSFTATMNWTVGADMDLIFVDCAFTVFKNTDAASTVQPEVADVTIPAGECWMSWTDLYSGSDGDVGVVMQ